MDQIDNLLNALNHAFELDPEAVLKCITNYTECNNKIVKESFIITSNYENTKFPHYFSPLGLLNGALSIMGLDRVAVMYEKNTMKILGFCRYEEDKSIRREF